MVISEGRTSDQKLPHINIQNQSTIWGITMGVSKTKSSKLKRFKEFIAEQGEFQFKPRDPIRSRIPRRTSLSVDISER
jgi:hypothetical protein